MFPSGRSDLPTEAVDFMARQVNVEPSELDLYPWSGRTRRVPPGSDSSASGFPCVFGRGRREPDRLAGRERLEEQRRVEVVHAELLRRCRSERIEAPSAGRRERMARSALRTAEIRLCRRIAGRLDGDVVSRLESLISPDTDDEDEGLGGGLSLIRSVPGNVV